MRKYKLKSKRSFKNKLYICMFFFLFISLGVGYSYLQKQLTINGTTVVSKTLWDVHFEGTKADGTIEDSMSNMNTCEDEAKCSKVNQKATISSSRDAVNFSLTFHQIGDYYEFYVDVINSGTIDAMLSKVQLEGINDSNKDYLDVSITYREGNELKPNDLLKANGGRERIKVRVKFTSTPDADIYASFTLRVNYIQSDITAKERNSTTCSNNNQATTTHLCRRASTLHTEVCNQTDNTYYCSGAGYSTGDDIIYGNCGTSGELKSGDAFDCDVDGNGVYDSKTERFYYVSDYYDTTTNTFNSDYATLIYYNNVKAGEPNNTATFAYDSSNENWHGPRTGYEQLPSTSQWGKVTLLNNPRQLLNEKGETTTYNGSHTLGTFDYTDKAARLLTVQEINQACNITAGSYKTGELDTCEYLLETTKYSTSSLTWGYWLESALSSTTSYIWLVSGYIRDMGNVDAYISSDRGVRPAIDVSKSNILY